MPGTADAIREFLQAAYARFQAADYARADAFRGLVLLAVTDPVRAWTEAGHLHFAIEEYETAGRAYGNAAAFAPRNAALQVRLGQVCLHLDDLPGFESYLNRALALSPDDPDALQLLADLNRDEECYDRAAGYYRRLIRSTSSTRGNLLSLALCCTHLGDHGTALECLQRAAQAARGAGSPPGC